jgi:uncharacterized protein (DUF3820 family)
MEHKIVTSVDVLGGCYSIEVVERVKKAAMGGPIQIDQALLEEKRRIEQEKEEAERKRRAQVQAKADYAKVRVDPFDQHSRMAGGVPKKKESGARFMFGKHKGQLVKDAPTHYLEWFSENIKKCPCWLSGAVGDELHLRKNPGDRPQPGSDDVNRLLMEARYERSA